MARTTTTRRTGGIAAETNGNTIETTARATVSRQRVPATSDPLAVGRGKVGDALTQLRLDNTAALFNGMREVAVNLGVVKGVLADRPAPAQLIAMLVQPDGTAAQRIQVQFDPGTLGKPAQPTSVLTDDSGLIHLPLPAGAALATGGQLALTVHGGGATLTVNVPFDHIAANGLIGQIALPQFLSPLPVSILAALQAVAPPPPNGAPPPPPVNQAQLPVIKIGDDADCLLKYGLNQSIDKFSYGVFFRLVEPRASIANQVFRFPFGNGGLFNFLPHYGDAAQGGGGADPNVVTSYVDRVPVDQPLSVDGFRDRLAGIGSNGFISGDETVPMAGTLGLGYVLQMSQRWTFQGLALGDLVYSLPLAPGEQQQVAIFERRDSESVFESENFSEQQTLQQSAVADTSTNATFNSAFNEVINAGSSFTAHSSTASAGFAFPLIGSGGGGSSSSSGTTSSSLQGQRDVTQTAAESSHSAASNASAARRSAARTGMRVASASESQSITTKTITNHNHTRALTMQYWEVLRLYDLTTAIDGLTLTVLVPLQVVRFLPPGQILTLTNPTQVANRDQVLARYASVLKHVEALGATLPRRYQHGLTLVTQFAADPTATVSPAGGVAEDVITFSLTGGFVPCEEIYVTAVTNRNTRVGPVRLAHNPVSPIPDDAFGSTEELLHWLAGQRESTTPITVSGALALPASLNRNSIVGFEISRRYRTVTYTLLSPAQAELRSLNSLFGLTAANLEGTFAGLISANSTVRQTITLTPANLEQHLGGPVLGNFSATLDFGTPGAEQYSALALSGVELTPEAYPVPAIQLAPTLRYNEILEIEKMVQHVVRNTMRYSQAVWAGMSALERAVLLEGYTIGVPAGGIADASQMVPLLNCVENRVLGYFGNSMILPFIIPKSLAMAGGAALEANGNAVEPIDPSEIVNSLLSYQKASFVPPRTTVALPTRGVLGEAVLGHCSSAEKIDLTRFWNWQDSPGDTAPTISPVTLPTGSPSMLAGVTAPNSLTTLPTLINNVLTAPTPDTTLLAALSKDAASQKDFDSSLTNAAQLSGLLTNAQNVSNSARADALKSATDLQSQVIATAGNIVGGIYGGNPTAGSSAAAAVKGKDAPAGGGGGSGGAASGGGASGGTAGGSSGGTSGGTSGGPSGGPSGGGTPTPVPVPTPAPAGGPIPA